MEITKEQIEYISYYMKREDWENVHSWYDDQMETRLEELDPEYLASLKEVTKGASFWYA